MEIPKFVLLLSCIYHSLASEHSHTIPIENYETELQDLGSHVESHNPPAKVIKITKTIAVKIPVPYPVKVIEKVPYPVHIAKPYPVPVPQIVHVPKHDSPPPKTHQEHEVLDVPNGYNHNSRQQFNQGEGKHGMEDSPFSGNYDYYQNSGGTDNEHPAETPGANYNIPNSYGYSSDNGDNGSFETNNQRPSITGNLNSFSYH